MPVDTQVAKSKVIGEENHYIRRAFFDCRWLIRDRRAAGGHQKRKHADRNSRPKRPSQYQGPHGRTPIIARSGVSGATNTNMVRLTADFFPSGYRDTFTPHGRIGTGRPCTCPLAHSSLQLLALQGSDY